MNHTPAVIDCEALNWRSQLRSSLECQREVDLINFDYTCDGVTCENFASDHSMTFKLHAPTRRGTFRKTH